MDIVERTNLSQVPPIPGGMKTNSIFEFRCSTSGDDIRSTSAFNILLAPQKLVPLSNIICRGQPRLDTNDFKTHKNEPVDSVVAISKCTAPMVMVPPMIRFDHQICQPVSSW
ncbi:hypothetical protein ACLKA6_002580 [Drosophila palustris]